MSAIPPSTILLAGDATHELPAERLEAALCVVERTRLKHERALEREEGARGDEPNRLAQVPVERALGDDEVGSLVVEDPEEALDVLERHGQVRVHPEDEVPARRHYPDPQRRPLPLPRTVHSLRRHFASKARIERRRRGVHERLVRLRAVVREQHLEVVALDAREVLPHPPERHANLVFFQRRNDNRDQPCGPRGRGRRVLPHGRRPL